jgi:hypothetical protein
MPTGGLEVLEQGSNLLFIKSYAEGATIPGAHRRIWQLLTSISNIIEAPGSITVLCVWGLADKPRYVQVFDYLGEDNQRRKMTREELRTWVKNWFGEARR